MRTITMVYFLLVPLFLFSQNRAKTADLDHRLLEVYEQDYLEKLQNKNPFLLERWTYYLDHAYYLTELPEQKQKESYPQIIIKDITNINILLLEREQQLKRQWELPSIYKIKGSPKYLVYLPGKKFTENLKAHLQQKTQKKANFEAQN